MFLLYSSLYHRNRLRFVSCHYKVVSMSSNQRYSSYQGHLSIIRTTGDPILFLEAHVQSYIFFIFDKQVVKPKYIYLLVVCVVLIIVASFRLLFLSYAKLIVSYCKYPFYCLIILLHLR